MVVGNEQFSYLLKEIRINKKLTLKQLADLSGTSDSYLSQLENGRRNPPKPRLLKDISKALSKNDDDEYIKIFDMLSYLAGYIVGNADGHCKGYLYGSDGNVYDFDTGKQKAHTDKGIGSKVKQLRLANNETRQELGESIKCSKSYISDLENGLKLNVGFNTIVRIAKYYNVPLDYFTDDNVTTVSIEEYNQLQHYNKEMSYNLNKDVPELYINGEKCGVVSMTRTFVTKSFVNGTNGTNVITFTYYDREEPKQKIVSFDLNSRTVFKQ